MKIPKHVVHWWVNEEAEWECPGLRGYWKTNEDTFSTELIRRILIESLEKFSEG